MFLSDNWEQYRILDTSGGEKLEDWNGHILIRPDPQIIWDTPGGIPCGGVPRGTTAAPPPGAGTGTTGACPKAGCCAMGI